MSECAAVSVVVIGRNEGERLRRCLASVNAMQRGGLEVETIYVDSDSSDGSLEMAAGMGARTIALKPVRPTAALGRNAGWRAAQSEFVLFLDGDTVLAEDFVVQSMAEFDDPRVAVVWGHLRELYPEHSVYNRVLDLDWIYAPGFTAFCGGIALYRRAVLVEMGGFDDTLIAGEEPELCQRIIVAGSFILHVDRAMAGHDLAITRFRQYWKRTARAGHAYAEVAGRFASSGQPFWTREVRRNGIHVVGFTVLVGAGIAAGVLLRSVWPGVAVVAFFAVIAVRSAWKARWKSHNVTTLLLYGVHSHFQQLPIFCGQIKFALNRRRGVRSNLVEYRG